MSVDTRVHGWNLCLPIASFKHIFILSDSSSASLLEAGQSFETGDDIEQFLVDAALTHTMK